MGRTWDLDPDGLLLRVFFYFLVAAVLITPKGAESPGSGRIGVIGALVFFPSEAV